MNRSFSLAAAFMLFAIGVAPALAGNATPVAAQDPQGKTCRMEQQCHWENFKKICTWVKVCR
jgi:hypothetical protein